MKQKIPKAINSKGFRDQAVKQVMEERLSTKGSAQSLMLLPSALVN
jgi:hypothetical protein